jgi:DNA-binding Lrp family transcriptional regulator
MISLDRLDQRLLFELDRNARQSFSALARALKQGRDRVEYRVQRLIKLGVIHQFSTVIDPAQLGLSIFKTYLKLKADRSEFNRLKLHLHKHPRVYWIAESDGGWDLMFSIVAANLKEFNDLQAEVLSLFSSLLVESRVYPLVEAFIFHKGYLAGERQEPLRIGGPPAQHRFDRVDIGILQTLSNAARRPLAEIAAELKVSPELVHSRIERLEELGVIKGYRVDLNISSLGMMFFKAQVFLSQFNPKEEQTLFEYCAKHPQVSYYIKQIGECRLEIELEVLDYSQYNAIVDELRSRFSRIVRNVEATLVRTDRYKWVPPQEAAVAGAARPK